MGIIKLDNFNRALISKWLFKYYDPTYDSKWKLTTIAKSTNGVRYVSPVWRDILANEFNEMIALIKTKPIDSTKPDSIRS